MMSNRMLLSLGMLGMAAMVQAAPPPEGTVLYFPNAGFEDGDKGWALCPMSTISRDQASGGRNSLHVLDQSKTDGSSARGPRLPVDYPGRFEFTGQVYTVSGDGVGLYVEAFDAAGKRMAGATTDSSHLMKAPNRPLNEWVSFRAEFEVFSGVAYLQVWIHSYSTAEVDAYLDDLQIRFVKDTAAQMARWAGDLDTIKGRLLERVQGGSEPVDVGALAGTLNPDGSWPDIDYADQERTYWRAGQHLNRMQVLASAYRRGATDPELSRDTLAAALCRALDFWYVRDPQNPNWWWNVIGTPQSLYRTLLMAEPALDAERIAKGCRIVERAKLGMTGQNLVWVAECTIARGCLQKDAELVGRAFAAIAGEIRVTTKEGIQPDFSFHQHGEQLYSGGYGRGFSVDAPRFAALAQGTGFAFSEEKVDILVRYLLDGQQWMVWNQVFDYSAVGRELARVSGANSRGLEGACDDLATLGHARTPELQAFAGRLRQGLDVVPALVGNRHFWRSEYTAHHRPGYFASVRVASKRLHLSETCNDENLRGEHLSDGVNFLYRTGEEYRCMMPVWDWRKLPGITAEQNPSPPRPGGGRGERSFAGGLSDGRYGLAVMDFRKGGLAARKAWFFFDDEYVCLGAGIRSSSDHPVVTTLNQCLIQSDVFVSDSQGIRRLARGEHRLNKVLWVYHANTAYILPAPGPLTVRCDTQTGTWKSISGPLGEMPVSTDVFSAWIDHGKKVGNGSYAYVVAPTLPAARTAAYAAALPVVVLANRENLQAVVHPGLRRAQMVFYEPGYCELPAFGMVSVDQSCALQVAWTDRGVQLAVSNPEHTGKEVLVSLFGVWRGPGARKEGGDTLVTVNLPGDPEKAGSTVLVSLTP